MIIIRDLIAIYLFMARWGGGRDSEERCRYALEIYDDREELYYDE